MDVYTVVQWRTDYLPFQLDVFIHCIPFLHSCLFRLLTIISNSKELRGRQGGHTPWVLSESMRVWRGHALPLAKVPSSSTLCACTLIYLFIMQQIWPNIEHKTTAIVRINHLFSWLYLISTASAVSIQLLVLDVSNKYFS